MNFSLDLEDECGGLNSEVSVLQSGLVHHKNQSNFSFERPNFVFSKQLKASLDRWCLT
jgi:hypothetical protein